MQNTGECNRDGANPHISYNSNVGTGLAVSYPDLSTSPLFYIAYGPANLDGSCPTTGVLSIKSTDGTQDQVGFTDYDDNDDYYIDFITQEDLPLVVPSVDGCSIDPSSNILTCTLAGETAFSWTCCSSWRFGTDSQYTTSNIRNQGGCVPFDLVAAYQ